MGKPAEGGTCRQIALALNGKRDGQRIRMID
jgi:hypothetical protein